MQICEYGCGQEATHQFQNGKWCCSERTSTCPAMRSKFDSVDKTMMNCPTCGRDITVGGYRKHKDKCRVKNCLWCGEAIDRCKKFCGHRCAAFYFNANSKKLRECKRGPAPKILDDRNYLIKNINNKKNYLCKNCENPIYWKRLFCSNKCQNDYKYKQYIKKWFSGEVDGSTKAGCSGPVVKWLKKQKGEVCWICGWSEHNKHTGNIPVEVHHIDGNWKNNLSDNLMLLCPNCHALTENYKASNTGNGREYRRKNHNDQIAGVA